MKLAFWFVGDAINRVFNAVHLKNIKKNSLDEIVVLVCRRRNKSSLQCGHLKEGCKESLDEIGFLVCLRRDKSRLYNAVHLKKVTKNSLDEIVLLVYQETR